MKILIVHASAGAGHTKAAEALYDAAKKLSGHIVILVDILDHTSTLFSKSYRQGYSFLVTKAPWLWGLLFQLTDLPYLQWLIKPIQSLMNLANTTHFARFLREEQFDYIFSTHFVPSEIAGSLKEKGVIASKIISVVTDFDVHRFWLVKGVDLFTVACDYTQKKLIAFGIPEHKIRITGIPVHEKFNAAQDKDKLKEKLQVKKGIFTVLMATGSFGIGPMEKIAMSLRECQTVIICGKNVQLFQKLSFKKHSLMAVFGLVHNMEELMTVADIMVTKPGGLSICEALIKGLPLIFFSPIPGQETHNIAILKSYGIGFQGSMAQLINEINRLKDSPGEIQKIEKNIAMLARPFAARDIIQIVT